MPSNLYGVANCPGAPQGVGLLGGSDFSCPANTETTIIQSPLLVAPSQGQFWCLITGFTGLLMGATPPSAFAVGVRFSGGSDINSVTAPTQMNVANSGFMWSIQFCIGPYTLQWLSPGSLVQITLFPQTNAMTAHAASTGCYFTLMRAPDA